MGGPAGTNRHSSRTNRHSSPTNRHSSPYKRATLTGENSRAQYCTKAKLGSADMDHFSLSSYVRFELQNKSIAREALTRIMINVIWPKPYDGYVEALLARAKIECELAKENIGRVFC